MSDADLVRNFLLNQIGDDEMRADAYQQCWLPVERAQGDGDPVALERFLRTFVVETTSRAARVAQETMPPPPSPSEPPPPPPLLLAAQGSSLLDGMAALLRQRGGSLAVSSLYAHGTATADASVAPVDAEQASRVAVVLMQEMCAAAGCCGTPPLQP